MQNIGRKGAELAAYSLVRKLLNIGARDSEGSGGAGGGQGTDLSMSGS